MPKISQEGLERERMIDTIEALRDKMREHLLKHPPEGPKYMLETFKREKAGFQMSEAWRLARQQTVASRDLAEAAANAQFKGGVVAKSLTTAINDILDAMIVVRTARRDPLFTNDARDRLVRLLATETVSHYTNYFARLPEPGVPSEELFHEVFHPDVWADYQVLVNLLQHLVTDCRERAELNRIDSDSRTAWASLGLMLEGLNDREYAMPEHDAASLIDNMLKQDREDRAAILLRKMPLGKPLPAENKHKVYSESAKKYCLRLWTEAQNDPGTLSNLARFREIDIDLRGRKVGYEDVYRVHVPDFETHHLDIKSAKEFKRIIRAAQTQLRRASASNG